MATIAGVTSAAPKFIATKAAAAAPDAPKAPIVSMISSNTPWRSRAIERRMSIRLRLRPVAATPDQLSGKVQESIQNAQEACSEDPASGECAAAWDEVEELSAEISHAKARSKDSDPLETYCKDNPETDECRTYDN